MALSVIGAGFGRTGTMSLKLALEQLGFGPCFHMAEFFISNAAEALKKKWERVAYGPGEPDWDYVFDGYRATVDWPSCVFFRELAGHYPLAKVILTVRDPERWFDSTQATIFRRNTSENLAERGDPWARMVLKVVNQLTFGGDVNDRDGCIAVYKAHNEAVRRAIPPERLLVYEAREGWAPLCRFLEVDVPDAPFPQANTTEEFQARRTDEAEKAAAEKGGA
ncbi:MAG: sulfotransferase family protein [Bauldia sp.]|nr:MAG: sulfotransferase family protein [Bauldia sp.]MBZ0230237.1 sulfotransferase family protein [Bauldia sp.]